MKGLYFVYALAILLCLADVRSGQSDLIYSQNGRVYEGIIIEEDAASIVILMEGGRVQIPKVSIDRIEKQEPASPTATYTPSPRSTSTRFPTSTPTPSTTRTPYPTSTPTSPPIPTATATPPYTLEVAEELIKKYEKIRIPKAKYVIAYFAKGCHALADDKRATTLKFWSDALKLNNRLFYGVGEEKEKSDQSPKMEASFAAGLERLRIEAKREPAAAAVMNRTSQIALRDLNLLKSWFDRHFELHRSLAGLYQKMQREHLALEHYLKAYNLIRHQLRKYQNLVLGKTEQSDPFNLRDLFFLKRVEVGGFLVDSRLVEIEGILDLEFDLQPDDYLPDDE